MKWQLTAEFFVLCLESALPALIQMTTNNIYQTYREMVDNNFDISNVDSFSFEVNVCNDGFVGLAETYGVRNENFYEVLIGGWGGKRLGIRDGISHSLESYIDDPNLADCDKFTKLWVSWRSGVIAVGSGLTVGENQLITWDDPEPHPVNYALISSGFGAVGKWKFYNVDGGWGEWGPWSSCVLQPGGRVMNQRVRPCNNPPPRLGGGCIGNSTEMEPCPTEVFWHLLQNNAKVTLGEHDSLPARSRIDCCRVCQQTSTCEAVSYDKTRSTCPTTTVFPQLLSLDNMSGWETWARK